MFKHFCMIEGSFLKQSSFLQAQKHQSVLHVAWRSVTAQGTEFEGQTKEVKVGPAMNILEDLARR